MYIKAQQYQQDIKRIISLNLPWQKLQNQSLLLTGASGLIGTMLIDVLMAKNEKEQLNCNIYAVGRNKNKAMERLGDYWENPNFHFMSIDVNQPIPLKQNIDYIIHAASNTHPKLYAGVSYDKSGRDL